MKESYTLGTIDLVLEGGMANCFFDMGVFRGLAELAEEGQMPFRIGRIIGNSSPMLSASLYLAGLTGAYAEIASSLTRFYALLDDTPLQCIWAHLRHLRYLRLPFLRYFFEQKALFSDEPLKRLIRKYLPPDARDRVLASPMELIAMTMDTRRFFDWKRHVRPWSTHEACIQEHPGEFYNVLFATIALPGFFQRQQIGDGFFCDGYIVNRAVHMLPTGRAQRALVIGLNMDCSPVCDVSHAPWPKYFRDAIALIVDDNARRMFDQFTSINRSKKIWEAITRILEECTKVLADAPPELRENVAACLQKIPRVAQGFDWINRRYIETDILTAGPMEEPSFQNFSNVQLEHLCVTGYRALFGLFLEKKWIEPTVAESHLRLLHAAYR